MFLKRIRGGGRIPRIIELRLSAHMAGIHGAAPLVDVPAVVAVLVVHYQSHEGQRCSLEDIAVDTERGDLFIVQIPTEWSDSEDQWRAERGSSVLMKDASLQGLIFLRQWWISEPVPC